jgi:hypothetical protein
MEIRAALLSLFSIWTVIAIPVTAQEPAPPDNLPVGVKDKALVRPLVPPSHIVKEIFLVPSTDSDKSSEPSLASVINRAKLSIVGRDVIANGLHGVMIVVANNTDRPLIFNGDEAIATILGAQYSAAPTAQLEPPKSPPDNFKGKLKSDLWATTTAAVTIGAVQTAIDQKRFDGSILGRYEQDEDRRRNEASRFGKRVVWPGDSSEGVLYFSGATNFQDAAVSLPVRALYNNDEQALLRSDGSITPSLQRIPAP